MPSRDVRFGFRLINQAQTPGINVIVKNAVTSIEGRLVRLLPYDAGEKTLVQIPDIVRGWVVAGRMLRCECRYSVPHVLVAESHGGRCVPGSDPGLQS